MALRDERSLLALSGTWVLHSPPPVVGCVGKFDVASIKKPDKTIINQRSRAWLALENWT